MTSDVIEDSLYFSKSTSSIDLVNQLDKANSFRTDAVMSTVDFFSETFPYTIEKNIFNETKFIWNEYFIAKLLETINTGIYNKNLNSNEFALAKNYIDFKYNNVAVDQSDVLISLDEYIGAL